MTLATALGVVIMWIVHLQPSKARGHWRGQDVLIINGEAGYELVDAGYLTDPYGHPKRAGQIEWGERPQTMCPIGPFNVLQRDARTAYLFLDDPITPEQADALIAAIPDAIAAYSLPRPTGHRLFHPEFVSFDFPPAPTRVYWPGVFGNLLFWGSAGLVLWSFCWFITAVADLKLARRRRALARNVCPRCGYDTRLLPEKRCPECGESLDA